MRRQFTMADQVAFARLSGDRNPMHMDFDFARRTQAGAPVVHGMHYVLWAFEELCKAKEPWPWGSVRILFSKFVFCDRDVALHIERTSDSRLRATISAGGGSVAVITLKKSVASHPVWSHEGGAESLPKEALDLDLSQIEGGQGGFRPRDPTLAKKMFPNACVVLGADRVNALAGLSALVGMVRPGLHSIFSNAELEFSDEISAPILSWRVAGVDRRVHVTTIEVSGLGLTGQVQAFVRARPYEAPTMDALSRLVSRDEFAGRRALVVGGSRGIGAVISKALAAGGADVVLTYVRGRSEAAAIVDDVTRAGRGPATAVAYDVLGEPAVQLEAERPFTHLYFCATPKIFRQGVEVYSASEFREFSDYYLDGFARLVTWLASAAGAGELQIVYPSSIALESRPPGMTTYAMAKAAGEVLAQDLASALKVKILTPRLPRILTDQTATVPPYPAEDAVDVMLPILRSQSAG